LPDVRQSGVRGSRLPDGAFVIEGLTEPNYDVYAEANGYEPERVRASLSCTTPVVIELANESTARVRVVDASAQQPVEMAVVQAWALKGGGFLDREATHANVESLGEGEFLVHGLGKRKTTLFVTAPGHAARMETIPGVEPGATVEHVVSLGLEGRVSGTMTTRDGDALAGVTVSATMPVGLDAGVIDARPTRLETVTGAAGEYELRGVGKGEWILHASLPKHVSVYETITVPHDGVDTEWNRVLVAGATIAGVLKLSNGRALADNDVHASLVSPEAPLPRLGLKTSFSAETGSQGDFVLEGLAPGTWQVGGKRGVQVTLNAGETRTLDVVLPTPATIVGRVISGNGAAVDAFVVAQQADGKSRGMGRTNASGEFEVVVHGQGEFSVQATCLAQPLGLTEVTRVTCQEDRVARCDLQVGGCTVSGRCLTGPDRKPFPGAMVVFARDGESGGTVLYFESDGDKTMLWPVSDQEGRFAFRLSPGKYFVTASADGYLTSGETIDVTPADTSATVDLELTPQ